VVYLRNYRYSRRKWQNGGAVHKRGIYWKREKWVYKRRYVVCTYFI